MKEWTLEELCKLIDHTNLHAEATPDDIAKLCGEAREQGFASVAINQVQAARCKELLEGSDVDVDVAVSFPLGQTTIESKVAESLDAISNGATEVDYVVNLIEVRAHNWDYVADEMKRIADACHGAGAVCKVIFENYFLTDEEKIRLCEIASVAKPDFIKTSTGTVAGGATYEDVKLMVEHVDPSISVKAAGGIRDAETFCEFVRLGARRIGTSAGSAIKADLEKMLAERGSDTIEL